MYSYEIEKQVLAALIQKPKDFIDYFSFLKPDDFYDKNSLLNKTIFLSLKNAILKGESIDEVVLCQRLLDLGIKFEDDINLSDYVQSLSIRKIQSNSKIESLIKELRKFTVRREISGTADMISKKMKSMSIEKSYNDIVDTADKLYNSQINLFENGAETPSNIYDEMEHFIEERGNNPIEEFGLMGPHDKINEIYGSLLRPGNITVIVARSGVGKTQFCMDYATKTAAKYDIPVLHFDNGEMSKEELVLRQCAALSGVPVHLLESGKWRQAGEETVTKVRNVWEKIKKLKFYY